MALLNCPRMGRWDSGPGWITEVDPRRAATLSHQQCRLVVTAGPDRGSQCTLRDRRIRVGAGARADLVLSDVRVSGLHFELVVGPSGCVLRDLGSRNGTFVGRTRIVEAIIADGATIRVGETTLQFEILDQTVTTSLAAADQFGRLLGRSPVMRECFARLQQLAGVDTTVLIRGETGTGKDLAAEALHSESLRSERPFAILDCSAISPNLVESELFGHEQGAFTGATTARAGVFERGNGGTVFLDEIGEMPLELQPKLLRMLESRRVRRIGGDRELDVDVRIVAATNRDLSLQVERGLFREDLYYRLAVIEVVMPPLRDRPEDLALLVEHMLGARGRPMSLEAETLALLGQYDWPGNVRELRNVVERAAILDEGPASISVPQRGRASPSPSLADVDLEVPFKVAKRALVDDFERRYVGALLDAHAGNISACARAAGVDRMVIHKIAERHGLRKRR